jgi:hypothetical protein
MAKTNFNNDFRKNNVSRKASVQINSINEIMNLLKKLLTLIFLFFFVFESFSQIKVEFKNGNTFTVSTVVFTNNDILLDLSPNVISKFGKLEIISVKYPNGKKIDWPSIASIISSDEEIKKMDEIIKIAKQKMDEINNAKPLKYEDIINVPNTEKKKIFLRSRIWFHKTFVDDKAVLSFSDFENGILIGNGIFRESIEFGGGLFKEYLGGYVKFSIRIYIKDNNYKYVIDGLVHEYTYIKQGTTIEAGMGLLTTSKDAPFSNTREVLAGDGLLEKLKFNVDIQIKNLAYSLKNAILNDTEADF